MIKRPQKDHYRFLDPTHLIMTNVIRLRLGFAGGVSDSEITCLRYISLGIFLPKPVIYRSSKAAGCKFKD